MEQDEFRCGPSYFLEAARNGIAARLHWPGVGEVTARELVLDTLLPIAHEGPRRWGVDAEVRDSVPGRH